MEFWELLNLGFCGKSLSKVDVTIIVTGYAIKIAAPKYNPNIFKILVLAAINELNPTAEVKLVKKQAIIKSCMLFLRASVLLSPESCSLSYLIRKCTVSEITITKITVTIILFIMFKLSPVAPIRDRPQSKLIKTAVS